MVNRSTPTYVAAAQLSPKMQLEQAKMTEVSLLLENLLIREEATVEQVLCCLYDIGSVNLIDQRVHRRSFNRMAKWIARCSKPVFKVIALRWSKRNCPALITNWLYTQVKFQPQTTVTQVAEATTAVQTGELEKPSSITQHPTNLSSQGSPDAPVAADATAASSVRPTLSADGLSISHLVTDLESYRQEVRLLHSQVKLLTTLLVGVTITLGSGLLWSMQRNQVRSAQWHQQWVEADAVSASNQFDP